MKGLLAFVLLFSGAAFALDESLSVVQLPVGTSIDFKIPRLEMPPNSYYVDVCSNKSSGYSFWMNYEDAPTERYFPERDLTFDLVKPIKFTGSFPDIGLCLEKVSGDCQFVFADDLKDIYFMIRFGEDKTISAFRKFVEGCGGTLTLPEPIPYP